MIGGEFRQAIFCDWTDDGNLLVMVDDGDTFRRKLVVLNRNGKLVRQIPMEADSPSRMSVPATWRKYGRR